MPDRQIVVHEDAAKLAKEAADWIARCASQAIAERGRFLLALSGGSTPEQAYLDLASPRFEGKIAWTKVLIFFGDERFVPPNDARSNLGMATRTLLSRAPIPYGNVFPIATQTRTTDEAAEQYETAVARQFGLSDTSPPPALDLVLLGLGDDGHTASLFPGNPSLGIKRKWFAGSPPGVLPPPVDRITATLPMLNAAREILFLVGGGKKANILKSILESPDAATKYPAAMVNPSRGKVTWLLDKAAAALLTQR